jgi:hypothetical protein
MLHAGLDLSRAKIDVCLLSAGGEIVEEFASPPDPDGLRGLTTTRRSSRMRRRRCVTGWAGRPERPLTARRPNDIAWRRPLIASRSVAATGTKRVEGAFSTTAWAPREQSRGAAAGLSSQVKGGAPVQGCETLGTDDEQERATTPLLS